MRTIQTINRSRLLNATRRMRTIHRRLQQARTPIVLLIALALTVIDISGDSVVTTSAAVQPTVVLQTPVAPMLAGTFQVVNNGPGDQVDPDLDCNVTAYNTQDPGMFLIHIINASTNIEYVAPGNGLDTQLDIAERRVAFTEANPLGSGVVVFDTKYQMRTDIPGVGRSRAALGGDLVAFEDRSYFVGPNLSELGIYDLITETDTRLTNDSLFDKNPAVSPTGNAVVWEKCQTDGMECDIYSAIQTSPGVFATRAVTVSAGEDREPDTNGQLVVYISNRSGENDIYFQPLAGGAETRIFIPGDQRSLSISGNLIAFASQVPIANQNEYDLFIYDLSTRSLYQVTNTPVDETGSRITFCSGTGRIVYVSPGADWDVYSFTFQIPASPVDQINALIALVHSFSLSPALESSLIAKLQDALAALNAADTATACTSLTSFISKVQTQSGKKITTAQATQLISSANQIKTNLGCP